MRLPYLQVAMEVIEQAAPDVAVALDWTEEAAGWGLIQLFKWALARCPEDRRPSDSDVVEGPMAARLIAHAGRWKGDPDAYVAALASIRPDALVEVVDGGIRICGLKRYDDAWTAMQTRRIKAKAAADRRWRTPSTATAQPEVAPVDAPAMPQPCSAGCSSDARDMLGTCSGDAQGDAWAMPQDAQIQIHTQMQKKEAFSDVASAPPALELVPSGPPPKKQRELSKAERLFAALEDSREEASEAAGVPFTAEGWAPQRINTQLGKIAKGDDASKRRFQAAWDAYLDEPGNASRSPPYSLVFFLASRSTWEAKSKQGGPFPAILGASATGGAP